MRSSCTDPICSRTFLRTEEPLLKMLFSLRNDGNAMWGLSLGKQSVKSVQQLDMYVLTHMHDRSYL